MLKERFSKISVKISPLKVYGSKFGQYIRTLLIWKSPIKDEGLKKRSWVTLVEKAKLEWEQSQVLFNEAQDPELIDHAIYAMGAAERKYMYLLKEARKERVVHEDFYSVFHNSSL
ncbi:MAG: DUF2508 family protein [Peptococcia bacterium]|jgi:hypothetical protein